MRIMIDIGHPADLHTFRNLAGNLLERGHQVLFTCREKEFVKPLLDQYGFDYVSFGRPFDSLSGKIWGLFRFGFRAIVTACRFRPHLILSHSVMYAAHAAFFTRTPHIALADTFTPVQIRLYKPFTRVILTGDYAHPLKSSRVIPYAGYHELAYLHPGQFTPDPGVLEELGLRAGEPFVIFRLVAWKALHDRGHKGFSPENVRYAVEAFSRHARVFISSESPLPESLQKYRFPLAPQRMHHAMAFARLVFGESASMAAESAMLGVPAIYVDNTGRCYTRDLEEKYGLVFNYTSSPNHQKQAIEKGLQLVQNTDAKQHYQAKKEIMLNEKINVTPFLLWFVESYPKSIKTMKTNPEYQYRFGN